MNNLEVEKTQELPEVKMWNGQRVVTFNDIDAVHKRSKGTSKRNFNTNKKHFIEGEDFITLCANEIRTNKIMQISNKARANVTLLTETGYLMIVKSFTDDLSWEVQRRLVNSYFKVKEIQNKTPSMPNKNCMPLPMKKDKWHFRNLDKIKIVCDVVDAPVKRFYHQFLLHLDKQGIDVDELNIKFLEERGREPRHTGEIIDHFVAVEEKADDYLLHMLEKASWWKVSTK